MKECLNCGKGFVTEGSGNFVFCSLLCRREHERRNAPKKREHLVFSKNIVVGLNYDDFVCLKMFAEEENLTTSQYIRAFVMEEIKKKEAQKQEKEAKG